MMYGRSHRFHSFIQSYLKLAHSCNITVDATASCIINRCQHCCSCETGCTFNNNNNVMMGRLLPHLPTRGHHHHQWQCLSVLSINSCGPAWMDDDATDAGRKREDDMPHNIFLSRHVSLIIPRITRKKMPPRWMMMMIANIYSHRLHECSFGLSFCSSTERGNSRDPQG